MSPTASSPCCSNSTMRNRSGSLSAFSFSAQYSALVRESVMVNDGERLDCACRMSSLDRRTGLAAHFREGAQESNYKELNTEGQPLWGGVDPQDSRLWDTAQGTSEPEWVEPTHPLRYTRRFVRCGSGEIFSFRGRADSARNTAGLAQELAGWR
jgi:hypothetical protein